MFLLKYDANPGHQECQMPKLYSQNRHTEHLRDMNAMKAIGHPVYIILLNVCMESGPVKVNHFPVDQVFSLPPFSTVVSKFTEKINLFFSSFIN